MLVLRHREKLPKGKQGGICLFSLSSRMVWLGRDLESISFQQRNTFHQPRLLQVHLQTVRMGMRIHSEHCQGL